MVATIMEYAQGGKLETLLKSPRVSMETRLDYFQSILRGVGAIHERGIAHQDLKFDNIVFGVENDPQRRLVPKILDFADSCI